MQTIFTIGDQIWTTKDGQKIRYRDLDISHIRNIAAKTFREREFYGLNVVNGIDCWDVEEHDVSFADLMQLELERRAICQILNIYL